MFRNCKQISETDADGCTIENILLRGKKVKCYQKTGTLYIDRKV